MFTELEAADKWCPFNVARSDTARCIGSQCMAWQWGPPPNASVNGRPVDPNSPIDGIPRGTCGLVNK
jgi:hypothetical protein